MKVQCVLWLAKFESVTDVQCEYRRVCNEALQFTFMHVLFRIDFPWPATMTLRTHCVRASIVSDRVVFSSVVAHSSTWNLECSFLWQYTVSGSKGLTQTVIEYAQCCFLVLPP